MTKRRLMLVAGVLVLVTILGVVSVGAVFAQTGTPPAQANPNAQGQPDTGKLGKGFGFGFRWGDTASFDAVAKALNLTPTQLFEQLHSGKTLSEIATAQGVDLSAVQAATSASRVQAMKDKIAQAVKDGTITQEQGDWLLQGLDKGYLGGHGFGFGRGGRDHGAPRLGGMMPGMGMRGFGRGDMRGFGKGGSGTQQQPAPSTSSPGTSY